MRTWDKSKPPTGPFSLNQDAPQAENLIAWYPLGKAGKLWVPDYAGPNHLTLGTDPGLTIGQAGGPVLQPVAASSQYLEGVASAMSALPLTLAGWCNTTSTGAAGVPICIGTSGGNARVQVQKDASTRQVAAAVANSAGSGATALTTGSPYIDSVDFHAAAVFASSTSRQAFLNGIGSAVDATSIVTSGMDRVLLGGRRNSTGVGAFWGGQIGEWGVWAQADDAAMIALRADPGKRFELWYPLRNKRWISMPAGGAGNASGAVASLSIGTAVAAATGSASASGAVAVVTIGSVTATAVGSASAAASLSSVTIAPSAATAMGSALATGSLDGITLVTPSASATGSALASGAVASVSVGAPTATANSNTNGNATGAVASLSITPASATATASGSASASVEPLSVSPPTATATGSATVSVTPASVSISAATATASAQTNGNAFAAFMELVLSPASASASGGASATGLFLGISLVSPTATADGGSPIQVAGAITRQARAQQSTRPSRLQASGRPARIA